MNLRGFQGYPTTSCQIPVKRISATSDRILLDCLENPTGSDCRILRLGLLKIPMHHEFKWQIYLCICGDYRMWPCRSFFFHRSCHQSDSCHSSMWNNRSWFKSYSLLLHKWTNAHATIISKRQIQLLFSMLVFLSNKNKEKQWFFLQANV